MAATEISWQEVPVGAVDVFKVPTSIQFIKSIGRGSWGCSAAFLQVETGNRLMVSKIMGVFEDLHDSNCILSELRLLQRMSHDNIIRIVDLYPPDSPDFDHVYVVKELMDTDLHRVIFSKQALSNEHHQYFTYQVFRGLLYLHSANIVHGDVQPSKLLVNKDCDLKISGFGHFIRRKCDAEDPSLSPRDIVACRWYHAPERMALDGLEVGPSSDVWAVGCILCELIGRKPAFTGRDVVDQITKIWAILGTPSNEDLEWVPVKGPARKFLDKLPWTEKQQWTSIYPSATVDSVALLEALLSINPTKRIDVSGALRMAYYRELHVPEDEPFADAEMDGRFMVSLSAPTKRLLQNHLYVECLRFHPDIEERDKELLHSRGLDVMIQSDRAQQPVVLTLHSEPTDCALDKHIVVSFTNLAGNVQASFRVDASKNSLLEVRRSLKEQFPNPVKLLLPNGNVLSHSQDSHTLAHIFQTHGDGEG